MAQIKDVVQFSLFPRAGAPSAQEGLRRRLATPLRLDHPVVIHAIRHGETETNADGLVTGSQDVSLTEHGRQQARAVGLTLDSHYDVAVCSALRRSR